MTTFTREPARDVPSESVAQVYVQAARAGDDESLRVLARSVAIDLKRRRLTPEAMLVRVKELFPNTAVNESRSAGRRNWTTHERVVAWCIADYFLPDD
ncbi:MAG TPA: hypothetical protein VH277_02835 [Gemmatimonadaceae bacterium]|nr:hypothetical protein [Gemmatimonadaceae bacterium]